MDTRLSVDFAPLSGTWKGDDEYDSEGEEEFADVLNVEVYVDVTRLKVSIWLADLKRNHVWPGTCKGRNSDAVPR